MENDSVPGLGLFDISHVWLAAWHNKFHLLFCFVSVLEMPDFAYGSDIKARNIREIRHSGQRFSLLSTSRHSNKSDTCNLPVDQGLPERRCNVEKLPNELDVTSVFQDLGRWCRSGRQKSWEWLGGTETGDSKVYSQALYFLGSVS